MESRIIEFIAPESEVTFEGSVTVSGPIGKGAVIKIKNGSLVIKGSVEPGVRIELVNSIWKKLTTEASVDPKDVTNETSDGTFIQPLKKLIIEGDVGEKVNIVTTGNVASVIKKTVASGCSLTVENGSILTKDLGVAESSLDPITLETKNGCIRCDTAGQNVQLKSKNGPISCGRLEASAVITSHNGPVECTYVAKGASIRTINGPIMCGQVQEGAEANITSVNGPIMIAGEVINIKMNSYQGTVFRNVVIGSHSTVISINSRYAAINQQEEDRCCCTIF